MFVLLHIKNSCMDKRVNVYGSYESCSAVSDYLWPHGLCNPWNSLGQNTGVVAFPFSRGSSQLRDWIQVSCTAGASFTSWVTREAQFVVHILIRSTYGHFSHLFNTVTPTFLVIPVKSFCHNDKTQSGWWACSRLQEGAFYHWHSLELLVHAGNRVDWLLVVS